MNKAFFGRPDIRIACFALIVLGVAMGTFADLASTRPLTAPGLSLARFVLFMAVGGWAFARLRVWGRPRAR